jgi:hypothetical protein
LREACFFVSHDFLFSSVHDRGWPKLLVWKFPGHPVIVLAQSVFQRIKTFKKGLGLFAGTAAEIAEFSQAHGLLSAEKIPQCFFAGLNVSVGLVI